MPKPQQPELRRSEYGATSDDSAKSNADVEDLSAGGGAGPVPEENQPGHHPEHDQDKPDPQAFVDRAAGE